MLVVLGMNGIEVDRHGLILWENDARGSRKALKYLPGLGESIYSGYLKNDLEPCGVIFPKYEPVASHSDPKSARNPEI